ncbi:uncharacterized protein [Atheta coriaria]|uniref:uncharacterized protein isoform X2 n=1 Tax=Dalotia coriaria TaxID=877792 RepID=UPI0031F41D38
MDCCNYMPYKNNYYGMPQYFDQMPHQYHGGEYYNSPYPSDYYGNTPYYSSHPWQCGAPPFPDYVYNPKEARIRKAMRDANRERSMGVAPATRAARRTQPWVLPEQDDQFMMASHGMRGVASPMCGNGFPIGGNGANGFMGPMHYNKHIHLAPHEQPYLQTNPMAQLQHQTEMWHYHESTSPMRPPTADQFMLPSNQMSAYQHHQHQPTSTQALETLSEKLKTQMDTTYSMPDDAQSQSQSQSPHSNANSSPAPTESNSFDERKDNRSINGRNGGSASDAQNGGYGNVDVYQEDVIIQNPFEKEDNVIIKKFMEAENLLDYTTSNACKNKSQNDVDYHKEYIRKYVETMKCDALEIVLEDDNNESFSYVTFPCDHANHYNYMGAVDLEDLYFVHGYNSGSCNNVENVLAERKATF